MLSPVDRRKFLGVGAGLLLRQIAVGQEVSNQQATQNNEIVFVQQQPAIFATGWPAKNDVAHAMKRFPNIKWGKNEIRMPPSEFEIVKSETRERGRCYDHEQHDLVSFKIGVDGIVENFDKCKLSQKWEKAPHVFKDFMEVLVFAGLVAATFLPAVAAAVAVAGSGIALYDVAIDAREWKDGADTLRTLQAKMTEYQNGFLVHALRATDTGLAETVVFQYSEKNFIYVWEADYVAA
jgi:hypothetical protein